MKTKAYQIFTVVSFFVVSISSTLAVSWGMNDLLFVSDNMANKSHTIVLKKVKSNDFCKSLKMLIPKI
jgi:hypothetical protein